jgi:DNA repair protein RAD16
MKLRLSRLNEVHPELKGVWEAMDERPVPTPQQDQQPAQLKLKLLPFQLEGLNWMRRQEQTEYRGGILADEMGMGKTIQMISLLLSEPRGAPNLIIAPAVCTDVICAPFNTVNTVSFISFQC